MKIKMTYFILTFLVVAFAACQTNNQTNTPDAKRQIDTLQKDTSTVQAIFTDNIELNEHLTGRLTPIKENFKRINSITNWTYTDKKDLTESTEGGEATFYYLGHQLEKIVTSDFGENFQQLTEYFLLRGELSFVYEKSYKYNRPMYYDTVAMKENNDTEAFDFNKSAISEARSYFEDNKLFHQVNNQKSNLPLTEGYLQQEQKRIKADFEKLIKLTTRK